MKQSSIKQNVFIIIFGMFIAVLSAELLFRAGALFLRDPGNSIHEKSQSYRIVCIGDSTTYGIGASDRDEFSYPSQLQKILDNNIPDKRYEVINLGIPGINSSQTLNRYTGNISELRPDTVIMMVGINDPWNFEESTIFKYYDMNFMKKLNAQAELMLSHLKVYQFFRLLYVSSALRDMEVPAFDKEGKRRAVEFFNDDPGKSKAFIDALVNNIAELKRISENNHINIVFMKYHTVGWGRPEVLIHNTYSQLKVPVVDNESMFRQALQRGLNVFGSDRWHPGDLGYRLIARNVFNKLIEMNIVNAYPVDVFE